MIEFRGELTGESKKFLLRKQVKLQTAVALIVVAIFSIPVVLASIFFMPICLLFFIPLGLYLLFSVITPSKRDQKKFVPDSITIDPEEETIVHKCPAMERFHMISSVKRVEDYGEWYNFVFNYEDRDLYFVCQKSLLQKGTIEDFEKIFSDKIVVKQ